MKEKKTARRALNSRRLRFGTTSTVLTAVVVAAVLLLNILVGIVADQFPVTWDLSADKVYTLKDESIEIAKKVTNDIKIVIFSGEDEFKEPSIGTYYNMPELSTNFKEIYTALQQFENYSGGKITYEFINPDQEPTKFSAYSKYEVQSGDILFIRGDRSKKCSILDMSNFEDAYQQMSYYGSYQFESYVDKMFSSNIYSLQGDSDLIVQVLTGHNEDSYTIAGLKTLYELNGFTFEDLNIAGSAEINPKAQMMLIAAPTKDYSEAEIKRVQEWVYNDGNYGRHLMVYVSPTADCPNLYEFLRVEYDITVTDELIVETDPDRCLYGYQNYLLCDVNATDFSGNAAGTGVVCTPFARRLTTTLPSTPEQEEASIYKLGLPLTSYPKTAKLMKLEKLNSESADPNKDAYSASEGEYPLTSMIVWENNSYNNNTYESTYGTVTVSGCSAMAQSELAQMGNFNNEDLLLDVVHGIFGETDSITISNKVLSTDTISFSNATKLWLGLGVFTVGIPLVLLVVCLVVFLRRKNL
ncbi:MAG: GldG family protein [Clostridia bacterium]|nr:GldG family protein [Clostridia bacterium]